jgi:glycosyltransferase involved in cell wall biosynthesis
MRILFLSNSYPPFARGGYEQWCQEVADELTKRGHKVCVLTSHVPDSNQTPISNGTQVQHSLFLEVDGGLAHTIARLLKDRQRLERENLKRTRNLIRDFQPDVALIWGMWNVPRSVPALVEQLLFNRVAYYICDYWLSLPNAYVQRWQEPSRRGGTQWPKKLLGKFFLPRLKKESTIPLRLAHPICVSKAVRRLLVEAHVPVEHAQVIYGGTQVEEFVTVATNTPQQNDTNRLKLLYAGRLDVEKGVHTAIEAMGLLADQHKPRVTLDIIGRGNPDYETKLNALVQSYHLTQNVYFRGSVLRSDIPAVFAQYDGLIFPSEWQEPFARTVLEAMAAGLVVIGATTGGTVEILVNGETGLTFPPGDAETLAQQLNQLCANPELRQRLAKAGQQCVSKRFTFRRMVDQIETSLQQIVASAEKELS